MKSIEFPRSRPKPRTRGMTMISDHQVTHTGWLPPQGLRDFLGTVSWAVDYAKIRADYHGWASPDDIRDRVSQYRQAQVFTYPGGILTEIAVLQDVVPAAFEEVADLGYDGVEVSENFVVLEDDHRRDLITMAREAGLEVIYEYGRKDTVTQPPDAGHMKEMVSELIELGVRLVVIERDEVDACQGDLRPLAEVARAHPDVVAFEAGPDRYPELPSLLLRELGVDVNLANLQAGQVLGLERFRWGLDRAVGYRFITEQLERARA